MFDLFFNVCTELTPDFQIIIFEHARLSNDRFKNALVDEKHWSKSHALIPVSWYKE
jgi:hypothetical protein